MAIIESVRGWTPEFGEDCYIAPNATIVGDVKCGNHCSFWFQSVIRGDVNSIRMGDKVNVQDGAVIHCTFERTKTEIGNNVSIGHNAIIHGCQISSNVLIGMGAIIMDNTIVEANVFVAAGAVVLENQRLESGFLYAGVPAKKIKPLDKKHIDGEIERIANNYLKYAGWYKKE
ncbi:MAG: gamma carbonic anhydrase family protein [Bacteroidia bacterium]|nr:gamma carbonic anhydrase family protein [Bacteroidia bacterium]